MRINLLPKYTARRTPSGVNFLLCHRRVPSSITTSFSSSSLTSFFIPSHSLPRTYKTSPTLPQKKPASYHLTAAKESYSKGNHQEAINHFDIIIKDGKDLILNAYLGKGTILTNTGHPEAALTCFDEGISRDPSVPAFHYYKGNAFFQMGKYKEAIDCYTKATELDPKLVQAHQNLGNSYLKMKEWEKSIECFDKVIELDPSNGVAHSSMGTAYGELEEHEEAINCFREALQYIPDDFETLYFLGISLLNSGEHIEALEMFELALQQREDDALCYLNKAYCEYLIGEHEDAHLDTLMALKLDGNLKAMPTALHLIKHYEIKV